MLYVISGSENTRLAKQKQAAQIAKVARENLGGKLSISIDEYNREINPSIVMHAIYEAYGLRKLDSTINENLDILG